jgi:SET family sugar efflux transporter-like MFS transporter
MIIVWVYVPVNQPPGIPQAMLGTKANDTSVLAVITRVDVLAHFSAFVLILTSSTIGMMNLPLIIVNDLGGTETNVGITYCVAPFFEIPLLLYFGVLATRHSAAKLIRFGILVAVAYYGSLTLVQVPWHVYPLQLLSATVTGITAGLSITYFQSHLPHHPGTATNLYSNAARVGSTLGYSLFGALSFRFGHRAIFVVCTLFAIASLALMLVPTREESEAAA